MNRTTASSNPAIFPPNSLENFLVRDRPRSRSFKLDDPLAPRPPDCGAFLSLQAQSTLLEQGQCKLLGCSFDIGGITGFRRYHHLLEGLLP